jgi:histidinol-phosphate aminotransferase
MIDISKIARPCILNQKEYIPGKPVEEVQREYGLTDIIKVASNENPLGVSPLALDAMLKELKTNINFYPEGSCHDLVQKLSSIHKLNPNYFMVDNGLDGVITMLGLGFINPGDEVVYSDLSFPAYANITNKMDGKGIVIPMLPDYRLDIMGMIASVTSRTKMIFLCNPNNPTGTIFSKHEFELFINSVPENVLVISDEAYYDFADNPDYPQTLNYLPAHQNLIILRTFSKVMGLAGIRVGFAMAHPDIIKILYKAREPFPVNRIAQVGALASLNDCDFINKSKENNKEGLYQYYKAFDELGIKYARSQTNFIFADLEKPAAPIFEALLRMGIIIRPLGSQGRPDCIRITIGTKEQNKRVIKALKKLLGNQLAISSDS